MRLPKSVTGHIRFSNTFSAKFPNCMKNDYHPSITFKLTSVDTIPSYLINAEHFHAIQIVFNIKIVFDVDFSFC